MSDEHAGSAEFLFQDKTFFTVGDGFTDLTQEPDWEQDPDSDWNPTTLIYFGDISSEQDLEGFEICF